jgi:hypothetical protein
MSEEKKFTIEEAEKYFAVEYYNTIWPLLENKERTEEENLTMIHMAHTSYLHWSKVGTTVNFVRGEWMLSRVYSVLSIAKQALIHARRSVEICEQNEIGDFDLVFAYEALARAAACSNDKELFTEYFQKALDANELVKDENDKQYCESELKAEPWFGIKE